jgi:hypothetical protein
VSEDTAKMLLFCLALFLGFGGMIVSGSEYRGTCWHYGLPQVECD